MGVRWVLVVALWGCSEGGGTPTAPMDAGRLIGDLGRVADQAMDAAPVRDARVLPPPVDAQVPDARPLDAAAPVCVEGEQACGEEGGETLFVCRGGAFAVTPCPQDQRCQAGACVDPLAGCTVGDPGCLGLYQPARCGATPDGSGRLEAEGEACGGDDICAAGRCQTAACAGTGRSYVGCEYWFTDLPSLRYAGPEGDSVRGAPLGLVVLNPDAAENARVWIYGPDGGPGALVPTYDITPPVDQDLPPDVYRPRRLRSQVKAADGSVPRGGFAQAQALPIPPGGLGTFLIEHTGLPDQTSHVRREGWRLVSDRPVVAYQFSPLCCNYSFSADASLLLPVSALGLRHRMVGAPAQGGIVGGLAVIATQPDTVVTVTPGQTRVAFDPDQRVVVGEDGRVQLTLQPHEVLTVTGRNGAWPVPEKDLSGALVESSAPVAAFTWHQCAQIPGALDACDHLEEQLLPVEAWGRRFVLVPLATRARGRRPATEVNYWKIVAEEDGTRIQLSVLFSDLEPLPVSQVGGADCAAFLTAPDELTLNAGNVCEFGTLHPVGLDASAPIQVAGLISGQESTGVDTPYGSNAGDPSLYLLAPDRQYRSDYPFLTPDTFSRDYVTVVADPDTRITLDGQPVDLANAAPVPGTTRVYAHVLVENGAHRILGDQPFGIVVYAFDDFVSYAYSGGLNLEKN